MYKVIVRKFTQERKVVLQTGNATLARWCFNGAMVDFSVAEVELYRNDRLEDRVYKGLAEYRGLTQIDP